MDVWVVEIGDYEDRHVSAVATSPDAARAHIIARFSPPYRVEWGPLEGDGDSYRLTGAFEAVPGYSIEHAARYDITRVPLVGA